MKKLVRTTGTIGTAAAIGLTLSACSKPAQTADTQPAEAAGQSATEPTEASEPTELAEPGGTTEPSAAAEGPDCEGGDRFTEACGYASPTKYAVLDPSGIRNA